MRVALFEPEIAGNVGAVLRLGACLGVAVDLIEPMGFAWDDRRVRRTAMDYIDHVAFARHSGFDAFRASIGTARLALFTTKASRSAYDFGFPSHLRGEMQLREAMSWVVAKLLLRVHVL